jgi:hypothetical protein
LNGHSIPVRIPRCSSVLIDRVNTPILVICRLALTAVCTLAALLVPNPAQAESLKADLDGDGIHDRIELRSGSRELDIRLSATRRWQRLHTNDLIVRFTIADVDHDGDSDLVANTRQFGLRVWINKGRGLFAARSGHFRPHHARLVVRHPRPWLRGVQTARLDDSTLNDSNRLLVYWSAPARDRLILVGETLIVADASLTDLTYRRRSPRGPPALLAS